NFEPLLGGLVAAVKDKAVRLDNRRRANILTTCPEARAACRAARAQNTFGGVVKALPFGNGLQPLPFATRVIDWRLRVIDHVWQHRTIVCPERLEVHDQVFNHLQAENRLDLNLRILAKLLREYLTG